MLLMVMVMVVIIMTMIIVIFNQAVVNNTPNEGNGLTALEVWVLSNIGLVFLAFLLAQMRLHPFSEVAPQKNQMSPTKDQNAKERGLGMLEIRLFFSVILATLVFAIVFFACYVI